jgi:hypothetical protein
MASELKHRLNEEFETIGIAKPGSVVINVVNSPCSDLKTLKRMMFMEFGEVSRM